jgi:protein TonB
MGAPRSTELFAGHGACIAARQALSTEVLHMTRSDAYGTIDKGAGEAELSWELPEGLWPAERRAIEPPPPALWRSLARDARAARPFAPLPVPPRAVGARSGSDAQPVFPPHIDSFFAPRESGAWARGVESESPPRLPVRPLSIPIPPAPRIASGPARAPDSQPVPRERARLMLHAEDERDAGLAVERRVFSLRGGRWIRVCGAGLLGVALLGLLIDGSFTGSAATAVERPASTTRSGVLQASAAPESPTVTPPVTTPPEPPAPSPSQPVRVAKRGLTAGVARGAFRHRARARRVEPAHVRDDSVPALEAPEPKVAQVGRTIMTPAVPISNPRPRYPELARRRGIGGTVVVGFTIDVHGTVRNAAIEYSDPAGVFDRAALQAIEHTRYRPRIEDGESVMTPRAKKRFTFSVKNPSGP